MDYVILYKLESEKDMSWSSMNRLIVKNTEPYNEGHGSEDDAIYKALEKLYPDLIGEGFVVEAIIQVDYNKRVITDEGTGFVGKIGE